MLTVSRDIPSPLRALSCLPPLPVIVLDVARRFFKVTPPGVDGLKRKENLGHPAHGEIRGLRTACSPVDMPATP